MSKRGESRDRTGATRRHDTIRLSAKGLAKVLGDLEARVMKALWSIGEPAPARAVHAVVATEHPVAIHTVITVLNNLVAKRLLRRAKRSDLYHYRPVCSEEEFLARASRRIVEGILTLGPDAVATSFVDVMAERDPERLRELMEMIRRRLDDEA